MIERESHNAFIIYSSGIILRYLIHQFYNIALQRLAKMAKKKIIPNKHISRPLVEPNLRFSNRSHCQKMWYQYYACRFIDWGITYREKYACALQKRYWLRKWNLLLEKYHGS